MSAPLPDWYRLIQAWISRGRYGLTIPFIVGARAWRNGAQTANRADIQALLNEIIESPVQGYIVYARWCEDYGAIVMASYKDDFPYRPQHNVIEFRPNNGTDPSLVVERNVVKRLGVEMNQGEIISALIANAQPNTEIGHFSRFWTIEGRIYGPFQEEDLDFIQKTLEGNAS